MEAFKEVRKQAWREDGEADRRRRVRMQGQAALCQPERGLGGSQAY